MAGSDKRKGILLAVAVLALLATGVTVAVLLRPGDEGRVWDASGRALDAVTAAEDPTPEPLTITPASNELVAPPEPQTQEANPGSNPRADSHVTPDTPADPAPDPEWLAYLAETRQAVTSNAGSLVAAGDRVMLALKESDRISLEGLLAPGEGDQSEYLRELALKYPAIQSSSTLPTVNIYSVGGTTVYLTYRLTTWEDGGIVSQHAVPIPLRFVDGQWLLTTLADTGSSPRFVQSVSL